MSVSRDLRRLAPRGEDIGGSLLRIGMANVSTEQLGAIFCIVCGSILAPKEFKVVLSRLAESTEVPQDVVRDGKGPKGKNKEVR